MATAEPYVFVAVLSLIHLPEISAPPSARTIAAELQVPEQQHRTEQELRKATII